MSPDPTVQRNRHHRAGSCRPSEDRQPQAAGRLHQPVEYEHHEIADKHTDHRACDRLEELDPPYLTPEGVEPALEISWQADRPAAVGRLIRRDAHGSRSS